MGLDFQFPRSHPLNEFVNASFDIGAVGGLFKFIEHVIGDLFFRRSMGFEGQLSLFFRPLEQFVRRAVGFQADQDSNLFDILQRREQLVKSADEKVSDQAIEIARVFALANPQSGRANSCQARSSETSGQMT